MDRGKKVWVLLLALTVAGCNLHRDPYAIEHYYNKPTRDSVRVEILAHLLQRPERGSSHGSAEVPGGKVVTSFRQAPPYDLDRFFIDSDSTHYFFLLHPVRHPQGYFQGIGGRFRLGSGEEIFDFEEIYHTPTLPEEDAKNRGRLVFEEMIEKDGNIKRYTDDAELVEWFNDRSGNGRAHFGQRPEVRQE